MQESRYVEEPSERSSNPLFTAIGHCPRAVRTLITVSPAGAQAVYGSIFGTVTDKYRRRCSQCHDHRDRHFQGNVCHYPDQWQRRISGAASYRGHLSVEAEASGLRKSNGRQRAGLCRHRSKSRPSSLKWVRFPTPSTVTASGTLLQTDRADVSTILNARAVEDLPNFNRNFTAFELLTPGTTYIGWGPGEGSGNPQRSESIEVNGQLPFATGYELDGTDNQDPLNGVAVINPEPRCSF